MFLNQTIEALQKYLVERDFKCLSKAINLLEGEQDNPSLQEQVLIVSATTEQISSSIQKDNSVKLAHSAYVLCTPNTGIEEDKLIRLKTTDCEEGSAVIMLVVSVTDTYVALVPVTLS